METHYIMAENNTQERRRKINEILDKFLGWETKYNTSPLFHQCVQMLVHGEDPYKLIMQIITSLEELECKYTLHLNSSTSRLFCPSNDE
jgi:hypothetical protein